MIISVLRALGRELKDLWAWAAFALDAVTRGKGDIAALTMILLLALIVLPVSILLGPAGPIFQGAGTPSHGGNGNTVLLPVGTPTPGPAITAIPAASTATPSALPDVTPVPPLNMTGWPSLTPTP